jgi:hypothetical protein
METFSYIHAGTFYPLSVCYSLFGWVELEGLQKIQSNSTAIFGALWLELVVM